ncbi:L-piperidine-6-carboxylate dehydrogenase [Aeromicrobium wangtongii]|uniref:aldehyde dehydrogenase (NAD(+)) n=1 Tax=Aeromicrobium wangtongii TaxID=2969247 RepID=A0ABY5M7D2_9ACTN|nr:aldehyde dehydrogenase family protein [Aeromicrobium wangtongii]MCD9199729.1 aldehyde dehydrogenase family protein [Aeromicrobium wangtongii]UUP14078.1 aldehyde dehydrogenase family protein [Aeromicrobium wangtongii]
MTDIAVRTLQILDRLGVGDPFEPGGELVSRSPIDGSELGRLRPHSPAEAAEVIGRAHAAFEQWRVVPAPVRGQFVRELGGLLREHKDDLGALVSIEAGKIVSEGLGEVQEMIDICDLALGLSRQLHGLTIATERPGHRMMEQWHPLGVVGVISAFNFPVAVWSWNAALAFVCGDAVVWKPSEKTVLTALACQALATEAARRAGVPEGLSAVLVGDRAVGEVLVDDPRVQLVSATGSTRMGKEVAPRVAARLGRSLLELGGNNAAIIAPSADLDLAVRGIVFSAVGTAGQRCTSLRRIIVHESIKDDLVARLTAAYETLSIGSPLEASTLVGPLIDQPAFEAFGAAVAQAEADGGKLVTGGEQVDVEGGGFYVRPAIVDMPAQTDVVKAETFAPVLYVLTYRDFTDALTLHNDVAQGLSSAIFTLDVREAELFMSVVGSDCGIANVNIGTSGAEIGGAFGGEKETGGGRESGSDAWRSYMRRSTNTINYSTELPLAQGVEFG